MADYDNVYDPTLQSDLTQLATLPEVRALLKQRMQYGREDSQTASPQGMRVGGSYIASSPWEHIASALKQGMGLAKQRGAEGQYEQSIGQERSSLAAAMDRYNQAMKARTAATSTQDPGAGPQPLVME